jgi:tetratricopeptide (TPR) repeat protein
MELTLTLQSANHVEVACNGALSHTFDPTELSRGEWDDERQAYVLSDPQQLGQSLYRVLFPIDSAAQRALLDQPARILIVTDDELDAIPWEFLYGPHGYLGLDFPILRGLPPDQRISTPDLKGTSLHIVAVPSNPIGSAQPLDIEGEWVRLREVLQSLDYALTLERVRPPTLSQLRRLLANKKRRVVHFMGHGGHSSAGAVLQFEDETGREKLASARDLMRRVGKNAFLVSLNACVSAAPGKMDQPEENAFANLARALAQQGVPYALGMRFTIPDEDAKAFARALYDELARGIAIEEALVQMRNELVEQENPFAVGIPVLYTSLSEAAPGFATVAGKPEIHEGQPEMDVTVLPRAEGAFQGRVPELLALGEALTGDKRTTLLTIHGGGGQGKTALAREVVERFAHAWPGGAWAISLENLPTRLEFATRLANFLHIPSDDLPEQEELERRVLNALGQRRALLVLDNAETLVEAVKEGDKSALDLVVFLRERLPETLTSLLVTSRYHLEWPGEETLSLVGLSPEEGALLFHQSAPQRQGDIALGEAAALSQKVDGHPLSLRLLGLTFNALTLAMKSFIKQYEEHLVNAEDIYKAEDHRHRSLYASIDTSVRYLEKELRELLSGLWIFHAPFLAETAVKIFDPDGEYPEGERSPIYDQLFALSRRGLLERESHTLREGNLLLYRLLSTMRPYVHRYLEQAYDEQDLLRQFGAAYYSLSRAVYQDIRRSSLLVRVAQRSGIDSERALNHVNDQNKGWYQLHWGWVLSRIGDRRKGLSLLEEALEASQGLDQDLEFHSLNNLGIIYRVTGQPQRALETHEQALRIVRESDDREREAATLNNMGLIYQSTGQPQKALEIYGQALPLRKEVGDQEGEAVTLNNMGGVYHDTGNLEKALEMYEQALPLLRKVGDQASEAATLNNIGGIYQSIGRPKKAMETYMQALLIMRKVDDRQGEATALNNMAGVYHDTGNPDKALEMYEQILPIFRELGDRRGEAGTLVSMGTVYQDIGQIEKTLEMYKQSLPVMREVGDRAGEATTLNNIGMAYRAADQPQRALKMYEGALSVHREVGNRAGEAATLNNMGFIYYQNGEEDRALELLNEVIQIYRDTGHVAETAAAQYNLAMVLSSKMERTGEAIQLVESSIRILKKYDLSHDASGATLNHYETLLARLRSGK